MLLPDLANGRSATVDRVDDTHAGDVIARRLRDLGFVPGEVIRMVTRAPWGGDPMLIQIGSTRFALRRNEAARVSIAALEEAA